MAEPWWWYRTTNTSFCASGKGRRSTAAPIKLLGQNPSIELAQHDSVSCSRAGVFKASCPGCLKRLSRSFPLLKESNSWSRLWDVHNREEPAAYHRWVLLSLVPMSPTSSGTAACTHSTRMPGCNSPPTNQPLCYSSPGLLTATTEGPSSVFTRRRDRACRKKQFSLFRENKPQLHPSQCLLLSLLIHFECTVL